MNVRIEYPDLYPKIKIYNKMLHYLTPTNREKINALSKDLGKTQKDLVLDIFGETNPKEVMKELFYKYIDEKIEQYTK